MSNSNFNSPAPEFPEGRIVLVNGKELVCHPKTEASSTATTQKLGNTATSPPKCYATTSIRER